jgi:hypothetical protein
MLRIESNDKYYGNFNFVFLTIELYPSVLSGVEN